MRQALAQAENYPFCTIEPNVAPIGVPDEHLEQLGALAGSRRTVPATLEWVDVAGLARGASRGEGLGNRFLAAARECDAICHVVRTFEDPDTIHVDGRVDPVADAEVVNLELLLADLAHAERRLEKTTCRGEERAALEAVVGGLLEGVPARALGLSQAATFSIKSLGLLTLKPVLYAFNSDELDFSLGRAEAEARGREVLRSLQYCDPARDMFTLVSAKVEAELGEANDEAARLELFHELGMELEPEQRLDDLLSYSVLPTMVRRLLGLSLAYTGPGVPPERSRTTRAHLFRDSDGLTAVGLAGRIHGEIERGLMCAEVASASALLEHASFTGAKDAGGCVRTEGRDYAVSSGDVVLVKWK